VYAPVNVVAQPSVILKRIHYLVHTGVQLACLHSLYISGFSSLPYIALICLLQLYYLKQAINNDFIYLQPRQWQFDLTSTKRLVNGHWSKVSVKSSTVLFFMVVIVYQQDDTPKKWWQQAYDTDIILFDACEAESFRQLRAYLRTSVQVES